MQALGNLSLEPPKDYDFLKRSVSPSMAIRWVPKPAGWMPWAPPCEEAWHAMLAPCLHHPPTHVHINILTVGGYSDGHTDIPTPIIIPIIPTVSGHIYTLQTDRHHTSYIDIRIYSTLCNINIYLSIFNTTFFRNNDEFFERELFRRSKRSEDSITASFRRLFSVRFIRFPFYFS